MNAAKIIFTSLLIAVAVFAVWFLRAWMYGAANG